MLGMLSGLTKSPVEAGDQGACSSADPSSFAGLPQFYGQVSRHYKRYFITFCLAFLKGNWSGITDERMKSFPIVISFYPHPEIV